ncbi:MAG: PAS domain S-box protein, partial [Verrucomicrobia bacterium]|nr:PAS domain S-box protein [Verrucomicrobiota bacterium]
MNPPIPPGDDRPGLVDRELFGPPSARFRFWLAMALPAGALVLQWEFWDYIRPFVWFFFYPAVFFSAWIGGKAGGIGATLFSACLVLVFFFPPEFAFAGKDPRIFPAGVLFITMGIFLSYFHDHLRRAKRTASDALESARLAHAQLEARVLERTAELERSHASLRDREELSSSALRLSPDCMLMIRESDGTVIMANEATGRLCGMPADQIVGQVALPYTGWLSDEERQGFVRALRETGECLNHETRLGMPDGRVVACSLSARRISRNGEDCLLCVVRDLTERRRAESANVTVAAIVESSDDAIVGSDLGGTVTSWNRGAERIFGFTAAEMVGCPLRRIVPPDRLAEQERVLAQVAQGNRVRHLETVRLRKDGTPVEISVTISPIKDGGGRVVGASKIARDITERKRTEAALRRAREQFAGMAASSPSVLCSLRLVADGRRVFDYAAPGIEGIFGVTAEEIVLDPTVAIGRIEATDQEESRAAIEESARTMSPLRFRFRVNHPRKGLIWVEGNSVPTRPAEGGVVWHGVMTDVTVQTRAEHALRESESRYRSLVDNLPAGVFRKDAAGRFVFVNGRFCEVEGFGPEMFLGRTATEVAEAIAAHPGAVAHDWRQTIHQTYRGADHHEQIMRTGRTIAVEEEWVAAPGGGARRYFQAVKTPVYGEGGAVVGSQGVLFEVTDRKRAEAALRESDERLRSLGDNLPDSYVYQCTRVAEGPARFLYLSAGVEKLHGLTAAEVMQDASRLYRQIAVEQLTA